MKGSGFRGVPSCYGLYDGKSREPPRGDGRPSVPVVRGSGPEARDVRQARQRGAARARRLRRPRRRLILDHASRSAPPPRPGTPAGQRLPPHPSPPHAREGLARCASPLFRYRGPSHVRLLRPDAAARPDRSGGAARRRDPGGRVDDQLRWRAVGSYDWGTRRMAYEIDHRPEAEYRLYQFNGDNSLLERLNQRLRITDAVLRFRIIKLKPGQPTPPPPDQQASRRRDDREPQDTKVAARAAADAPPRTRSWLTAAPPPTWPWWMLRPRARPLRSRTPPADLPAATHRPPTRARRRALRRRVALRARSRTLASNPRYAMRERPRTFRQLPGSGARGSDRVCTLDRHHTA